MATSIALYKKVNNDWIEVTTNNRATVLEPNDELKLTCSTDLTLTNLRIKVAVGGNNNNPEIEDIIDQEFSTSNEFVLDNYYVTTHNISFIIQQIQIVDEDTNEWVDVSGATISLQNYNYPLEYSIEEVSFIRIDNEEYDSNPNGTWVEVNKIQFSLNSGTRTDIESVTINIYENNGIVGVKTLRDSNGSTYVQQMFTNGYSDTSSNYLFEEFNNEDVFINLNSKFYFSFIIKYKKLTSSVEADYGEEIVTLDESNRYSLRNSITSLYLVGKTKLPNDTNVYGGVSIGKEPNIKNIGQAAFECGYPSYFTNRVYINNYQYGYYAGEEILFSNGSTPYCGMITGSRKQIFFTVCLGQPIFANSVSGSGNMYIRLGEGGYINTASANSSTMNLSSFSATIINKRAGIIQFSWSKSSEFKKYSSSSSSGTTLVNNQTLAICINNGKLIFR